MTVRIVKGTFGWFDGKRVRPVTKADGPKDFDPDLEARLVAEGVAEWAGAAADEPAPAVPGPEEAAEADTEPEGEPAEALEDMTKAELEELAKSLGVPVGKKTKAELAEAIAAAEEPPAVEAAEVE